MFGSQFTSGSNDFIAGGIVSSVTTPDAFQAAGLASQRAQGPITQSFSDPVLQYAPQQLTGAIQYGSDPMSDQSSNYQMADISTPIRLRAWDDVSLNQVLVTGTQMFNSTVPSLAGSDKATAANLPMLNRLHQIRAINDALEDAKQPVVNSLDNQIIKAITAKTPSQLKAMWSYVGALKEPSQTNPFTNEPVWGVTAPGKGVVSMTNCFGVDVHLGDIVGFSFRLEDNENQHSHSTQPKQFLRVRGFAQRQRPARNSSKTLMPTKFDLDTYYRGVNVPRKWETTHYDPTALPGQRYKVKTKIPLSGVGAENLELVGQTLKCDLYEHGDSIQVGIVTEIVTSIKNPTKELLHAAHFDTEAFRQLPLIKVAPFVRQ